MPASRDAPEQRDSPRDAGPGGRGAAKRSRRPTIVTGARAADPNAVREAALRLLDRSRRTRSDLERKLAQRGFESGVVAGVLDRLAGVGLIDDIEYAKAFLAGRWGRRAAGWRRLEADLRNRGIAVADIMAARDRFEAERGKADEVSMALRVVTQSARRYAALDPRTRRQRVWALLARRGFDGDVIAQALAADAAAADDDGSEVEPA